MKILEEKKLLNKIQILKKNKKKIVLCHGVFDLIHHGHIEHFKSAKKFGDYLIVSLTMDKFIKKGPGRPLFNEQQRMEFLRNLKMIDYVMLSKTDSSVDIINFIKPDFYVKGPDYKNFVKDKTKKIILEERAVRKNKGNIKFTNDITFSSSSIINSNNFIFNTEQKNFIDKLKKKFNYNQIESIIKKFKSLRVLLIGEFIIDKYCFGDVLGKSGKEPHLVLKEIYNENYLGGSAAVARHLSTFVKEVILISPFANEKFFQKIVNKNFNKNIKKIFFKLYSNFKTIVKTRFVDKNSNYKLFGSYLLPGKMDLKIESKILKSIKYNKYNTDMTIVCDYGHNFISKKIAGEITKSNNSLFLNAQVNSSSRGFHNIEKYSSINSIILNENELRQEFRDKTNKIEFLAKKLINNKKIQNLIITRGANGAILINKNKKIYYCPGFARKSIDKVGAGDTMLALASLGFKLKLDPELVLFISSLAASISVENIGNSENITYDKLDRILEYILK
jgi:rfaE bifunctional protein kinase chain/domain/rfaE bifunctional protein nucleotidyltransferase chain/domain